MYSLFQMLYLYSKIILKFVQLDPKRQLMYESHSQGADPHTVNKLRSLNLLFPCMFCVERKIVHVGTEKIVMLY